MEVFHVKKLLNDLRFIFTALQVCSVIAILVGFWTIWLVWPQNHLHFRVLFLTELALWCVMWIDFLRMCGRLKREPTAFTERNAKSILLIAICCGLTGLMLTAEMMAELAGLIQLMGYGFLMSGYLFSPLVCFGVMIVALVLHRLLRSAIALQQDSDLTI